MPAKPQTASDSWPIPDSAYCRWLRRRLLAWFEKHQRVLPWRKNRDPYRIWISEVMLQQTQAATVVRFFDRFLQAFPTLAALAAADEQDVLRQWEGLGYYGRARNLHQAARLLAAHHDGQIPADPSVLEKLPGIGRYILGAVLSQAYDQRLPIVEANSERVLCRLFAQRKAARSGPVKRWLWQVAEDLLPTRRVGDFNQALMELGALICTPAAPRCDICPLASKCQAHQRHLEDTIPVRGPAPATVAVKEVSLVVRRGRRVLLVQRPGEGRWAGMWEFPHGPLAKGESHEAGAARLLRELTDLRADVGPELTTLRHTITRFCITLTCFEARYRGGKFRSSFYEQDRWVMAEDLPNYPVSTPQRRLAQELSGIRQCRLF